MRKKVYTGKIIVQPETEVFFGQNGHIVIKQEDYFENDVFVVFNPYNIRQLINELDILASKAGF